MRLRRYCLSSLVKGGPGDCTPWANGFTALQLVTWTWRKRRGSAIAAARDETMAGRN